MCVCIYLCGYTHVCVCVCVCARTGNLTILVLRNAECCENVGKNNLHDIGGNMPARKPRPTNEFQLISLKTQQPYTSSCGLSVNSSAHAGPLGWPSGSPGSHCRRRSVPRIRSSHFLGESGGKPQGGSEPHSDVRGPSSSSPVRRHRSVRVSRSPHSNGAFQAGTGASQRNGSKTMSRGSIFQTPAFEGRRLKKQPERKERHLGSYSICGLCIMQASLWWL